MSMAKPCYGVYGLLPGLILFKCQQLCYFLMSLHFVQINLYVQRNTDNGQYRHNAIYLVYKVLVKHCMVPPDFMESNYVYNNNNFLTYLQKVKKCDVSMVLLVVHCQLSTERTGNFCFHVYCGGKIATCDRAIKTILDLMAMH